MERKEEGGLGLACAESVSLRKRSDGGFTNSNSGAAGCARRIGGRCGGTVCARVGAGRTEDQQNELDGVREAPADGRGGAVPARAVAGGKPRDGVAGVVRQAGRAAARAGAAAAAGGGEGPSHESQTQCATEGDLGGGQAAPGGDQGGSGRC